MSAEALMLDPAGGAGAARDRAWCGDARGFGRAGEESGPQLQDAPNDVLDERLEAEWFPDETPQARAAAIEATQREATRSLALQRVQDVARTTAQTAVEHGLDSWR